MGVLTRRPAAPFDAFTIPWHCAVWASDPSWANPVADGPVASWRNGGSFDTAITATGTARPSYRSSVAALASRPGVEFDGVANLMKLETFTLSQPNTRVIILYRLTNTGQSHFFGGGDGGGRNDMNYSGGGLTYNFYSGTAEITGPVADSTAELVICEFNGASSSIAKNGGVASSGDSGSLAAGGFVLGGYTAGSNYSNVVIGFAGLINRLLTASEKSTFLAWSRSFYGTP